MADSGDPARLQLWSHTERDVYKTTSLSVLCAVCPPEFLEHLPSSPTTLMSASFTSQLEQPLLVQPAPTRRIDARQLEFDAINPVQCSSETIYGHPMHPHHQQQQQHFGHSDYVFVQDDATYYYPQYTYCPPPSTPLQYTATYPHHLYNAATGAYEPIPYTTPDSSASNTPRFPTVAQQRFYHQTECYYPPQHYQSPTTGVPQLSLAAHIQHVQAAPQASTYLPLSPVSPVQHLKHQHQHHHQPLATAPPSPQTQLTSAHPHQLHTPVQSQVQQTHSFIQHDGTSSPSSSTMSPAGSVEDERLKKLRERRHVVACLFCRGRKIACHPPPAADGERAKPTSRTTPAANRPSCDNCIKRGRQCVYPERVTPRAPRRRRRGVVYDEEEQ
ncbi:hypothetical protein PIIN_04944 [Serendipita indica DSM 11827]|uniref:Zn(2)-C6 fungal-type domain-containing protein n=1 Tax=Serendipita indica (strain DSM 11827) TaxID=1109443 RepID=G4TI67_SERID|nr:hypothetical protein PIIN_04944 [Serendipita indica DSM 11827]